MDSWDSESNFEPRQKEAKTIYSQSFSRGRGGNRGQNGGHRGNRDRNSDGNYQQDRRNYGRNQNDSSGRSNNYDRGNNQRSGRFNDNDNRDFSGGYGRNQGGSSKSISVESRNLGRVIGRGGTKIKQLEQDSGARININRENRGGETTEINLSGTEDQISKAEEMINECMSGDSYGSSRQRDRDSFGSFRQQDRDSFGPSKHEDSDSFGPSRPHDNDSFGPSRSHEYDDSPRGYKPRNNSNYSQNNNGYQSNYSSNQNNYERDSRNTEQSQSKAEEDDGFVPIDWASVYSTSEARSAAYLASLPPIVKQLYKEDPEVANMTALEVAEFRLKNMNISVSRVLAETDDALNVPIPNPVKTFEQAFRPYPDILKTIRDQNFQTPSPIQSQAWPVIMSGEDLIGIAQTGTGKTLAFLLPAMIHIEAQPTPREERVGPSILILSPTRELALQIEKEINKYSYRNIKCVCIYGGGDRKNQIRWLNNDKPEIVVATPGRLDDLVMNGEVKLDSVTYVVLDEADKMLEMGFECQIRKILINIRSDRQTVMTSATWPSAVRRLASQYSVNPVQVVVGSLDLTAVHSVTQRIEIIDEEEKRERLNEFLREMGEDDKVIVFCGKKSVTDDISSDLILQGTKCQSLHGDREQCDREQALHDLKTGEVRILIATDVAARGLDIADITHIFNYDFPRNIEEYVHRIGRTGRAGRSGESVSLFTRRDWANAADLIKILEEANQGVPEELFNMAERFDAWKKRKDSYPRGGRGGGRGRGGRGGGGRW